VGTDGLPVAPDLFGIGIAVRGQPHELVLPGIDPEAQIVGEGGVEQPDGMGEAHLLEEGDVVVPAVADGGGGPFPDAVDGQDRRFGKGRGEEGAGGVGQVVIREEELDTFRGAVADPLQLVADQFLEEHLLLDPHGNGGEKGLQTPGGEGVVGLQKPLEFQQRLVVEDHGVQILHADPGPLQAEGRRMGREGWVVLLPGEALLLGGGDDLAVLEEGGGGIVIKSGDA